MECGVWKGYSIMTIAFTLLQKKSVKKNIYFI